MTNITTYTIWNGYFPVVYNYSTKQHEVSIDTMTAGATPAHFDTKGEAQAVRDQLQTSFNDLEVTKMETRMLDLHL